MDGQGSLKVGLLRFGAVEVRNLESKLRLESRRVFFTDVKAGVYGGSAVGGLSFDLSGKNASFMTNARLSGINLAQLLAAFPQRRREDAPPRLPAFNTALSAEHCHTALQIFHQLPAASAP